MHVCVAVYRNPSQASSVVKSMSRFPILIVNTHVYGCASALYRTAGASYNPLHVRMAMSLYHQV